MSWLRELIVNILNLLFDPSKLPDAEEPFMPVVPETPIQEPENAPEISKLDDWAHAMEFFESGGDKNAPSYQRHNPGNIRGSSGQFLTFKTYQEGYDYLKDYLRRAATDNHQAYVQKAHSLGLKHSGLLNILQFIQVYTFGDSAEIQRNYTNCIATRCNVFPSTHIEDLL